MEKTIYIFEKKLFSGELLDENEAQLLKELSDDELFETAEKLTRYFLQDRFDTCSIINAKNGNCSEDCKWCAQSSHFKTGVEAYSFVDEKTSLEYAKLVEKAGIKRFSFVSSGKRLGKKDVLKMAEQVKNIKKQTKLDICASAGLLDEGELKLLYDAGVRNCHCNIETSPKNFKNLCTTHSFEDKIKTIKTARKLGFRICSGGIIGMGESEDDRIKMALFLQELKVFSIPINILSPIAKTPLENTPLLSVREILRTIAYFRLINPKAYLRFSGGRARLSLSEQKMCLKIGINSMITGDLLTTTGGKTDSDMQMIKSSGYDVRKNSDWE